MDGRSSPEVRLRQSIKAKAQHARGNIVGAAANRARYDPITGARHPCLCQFVKFNGKLCDRWPKKGKRYCPKHRRKQLDICCSKYNDMQRKLFYEKRIGPKLTAMLRELLDNPEQARLRADEELELMRCMAADAIALYSGAQELPDTNPDKGKILLSAGQIAFNTLAEFIKIQKTAKEIALMGKDQFSVIALHDVVRQLTKMVYLCFDPENFISPEESLQWFDEMLTNELQLPQVGARGTTITPDQDVRAMDSSIPVPRVEYNGNGDNSNNNGD